MGYQSTESITRDSAISRIQKIAKIINQKDYLALEENSNEENPDVDTFISILPRNHLNRYLQEDLNKWTNKMLQEAYDQPYFRMSHFYNYTVFTNQQEIDNQ